MTATAFIEARHPMDGVLECLHQLSIDEVIIAQNQTILVGQVLGPLGVVADMTVVGAAGAGNVGTSTIGSISASTFAQNGVYNIVLLATSSTGEFEVQNPSGTVDGTGKIGTAYTGGVNFTITAAGTPTIGDSFTVTVTRPFDESGEQYEAWGPGAADGSQAAAAIALYPAVTGSGQTQRVAALRRDAAFRLSAVNFGSSSFTGSQSTTTLTVTAMAPGSGPIVLGATVSSTGTSETITAFGTGTGGVGTYTVSVSQTLSSQALTAAPTTAQTAFAQQQLAAKNIVLR
jgi:head decoration protein D